MTTTPIKKQDDELQIVWGEVYVPGIVDSEGDFMTTTEIREMAYRFMRSKRLDKVDVQHDNKEYDARVVESFIARDDDPLFLPGAWVVAVHIGDPELWALVKSQEINGYSMEGLALTSDSDEYVMPETTITGETSETDGHKHRYKVFYDAEGNFLGGETDYVDGHRHLIVRGTLTEEARNHAHTFAVVDAVLGNGDTDE
jgi:hypothetical protein